MVLGVDFGAMFGVVSKHSSMKIRASEPGQEQGASRTCQGLSKQNPGTLLKRK